MGREYELKYAADEKTLAAIEREYAGFRVIRMETTYYDDVGGNLSRLRWTVRRRMENGVSVCTVKTSLPDGSRGEWEVQAPDVESALPRLIEMGAPPELAVYAANGLHPSCGARFTRRAALLPTGDGQVELALDSGVLLGGGRELPFAEVEVEQKQGTDAAARAFAEALARRFHLQEQPLSKLNRALSMTL